MSLSAWCGTAARMIVAGLTRLAQNGDTDDIFCRSTISRRTSECISRHSTPARRGHRCSVRVCWPATAPTRPGRHACWRTSSGRLRRTSAASGDAGERAVLDRRASQSGASPTGPSTSLPAAPGDIPIRTACCESARHLTRCVPESCCPCWQACRPNGAPPHGRRGSPMHRWPGSRSAEGRRMRRLGRYLATRLVGSWVAYQGTGLRSVTASLVSAYVLTSLALQATAGDGSGDRHLGAIDLSDPGGGLDPLAPAGSRRLGPRVQRA